MTLSLLVVGGAGSVGSHTVKLLLDTHIALWAAEGAPQLSATAAALIEHPQNTLYVSAASIWEIAIKYRKGNLPVHPRDVRSAFMSVVLVFQ